MSKNDDILSQIGGMYILYKLRWVILIGIIIFGVVIFFVNGDLDNEYQQYGYNGFSDNIKYDEWTDEIIPKNKIETRRLKLLWQGLHYPEICIMEKAHWKR